MAMKNITSSNPIKKTVVEWIRLASHGHPGVGSVTMLVHDTTKGLYIGHSFTRGAQGMSFGFIAVDEKGKLAGHWVSMAEYKAGRDGTIDLAQEEDVVTDEDVEAIETMVAPAQEEAPKADPTQGADLVLLNFSHYRSHHASIHATGCSDIKREKAAHDAELIQHRSTTVEAVLNDWIDPEMEEMGYTHDDVKVHACAHKADKAAQAEVAEAEAQPEACDCADSFTRCPSSEVLADHHARNNHVDTPKKEDPDQADALDVHKAVKASIKAGTAQGTFHGVDVVTVTEFDGLKEVLVTLDTNGACPELEGITFAFSFDIDRDGDGVCRVMQLNPGDSDELVFVMVAPKEKVGWGVAHWHQLESGSTNPYSNPHGSPFLCAADAMIKHEQARGQCFLDS